MRAVVMRKFGPPEVLQLAEATDPVPAAQEVIIDVELANVTFVETQIRAGKPPHPGMRPALPAILGNGVGGVITELGAQADPELLGRRVVTSLGGSGGYAERAAAPTSRLIDVPGSLRLTDGVALLSDGRTALSLMDLARPREGEVVVVEAAAGGVGTLLVQLAHHAGARVVALAGGEDKLTLASDLGADTAVDYRTQDWAQQVRDTVGDVDVAFDGVGGDAGLSTFGLLRPGGRFCPFGMASGSFAPVTAELAEHRQVTVLRAAAPTPEGLAALTRRALAEAAAGRIRPIIGQQHDLSAAATAHTAIQTRATVGKTLLVVPR
jgi:NADPH:quinone reductase